MCSKTNKLSCLSGAFLVPEYELCGAYKRTNGVSKWHAGFVEILLAAAK